MTTDGDVTFNMVRLPEGFEIDPERPPARGPSGEIEAAYAIGPDPSDPAQQCEIQLLFDLVSVPDPPDGSVMSVGIWCAGSGGS